MDDIKIGFWDLENSPLSVKTWTLWPNSIPINMVEESQRILCFGYRWYGQKKVTVLDERGGQEPMLQGMWDFLNEADFVVSWNGAGFDTKHANTAFQKAGMTPPSPYKEIDLMKVAKSRFKYASNKLDWVAQELGVGKKADTGGYELWRGVMAGDDAAWRKMIRYQRQDVNLLVDLFEHFKPWIKFPHPVSAHPEACHACGSLNVQRRGYHRTLVKVWQRFHCQACGAWFRGRIPQSLNPSYRSV